MFLLMVTWLTYNQPPVSSQSEFTSMVNCEAAKAQIIAEGERLRRESDAYYVRIHAMFPGIPPRVSAVCVKK
jgi:hypothetical protein